EAEQEGFRLVFLVMRNRKRAIPGAAAGLGQQEVARFARSRGNIAVGLLAPTQRPVRNAARGEPALYLRRFARRFRPEAVIDRDSQQSPAALGRPLLREQDERQAIGPSGNGDGKVRLAWKVAERRHQAVELGTAQHPLGRRGPLPASW